MIRQRALAWAAALTLAATVSTAPFPARFSAPVTSALAQEDSAADAGEPADLAIAALNCAEAPATEALTSFFTTGAAPRDCSPAVGVTVSVSENGAPVPGSPFTTDVAGIAVLPVSPGAAVEVNEDPTSLPSGYEPLTNVANGVPYANPVQIDSAVAGAAVLFVNVPRSVATELAQAAPAAAAGEPTDLAVMALQCADAPDAETLTAFFSSGTPPGGCAPAVGVRVAVTENGLPLAGSPFTTDADGALTVPVRLGAAVSVKEDGKTLSTGYAPLTEKANGVPYANPVQIDAAAANAAVLFVNVPAAVAADLASDSLAVGAARERAGCDPAYPDERTCIAPGRPLAAPCAITDQRNFTVLAPDPRGLDADHDGIGCEPISPRGGTIARDVNVDLARGGGANRRAAPASSGVAAAASRGRSDDGARVAPPERGRANAQVVRRDRGNAGLWSVAPARPSTGDVAIGSNPDSIANWRWGWPNRFAGDDGIWRSRNPLQNGVRFLPNTITIGNVTVAGSGSGNVAIASNPVFIGNGVWAWPDRNHGDDWPWRNRFDDTAWFWPDRFSIGNVTIAGSGNGQGNVAIVSNPVFIGNGLWSWPHHRGNDDWFQSNFISVGNISVAGSGNGNIAIASNPVFISSGVWRWPGHSDSGGWLWNHRMNNGHWRGPNRFGTSVWGWPRTISVGNLVIARSGDNIAIVSNPVVIITGGLWFVPPDRNHDDHWYDQGEHDHGDRGQGNHDAADAHRMPSESAPADRPDAEAEAIDGGFASEPTPDTIEPLTTSEQPTLTVNGELAVAPAPTDSLSPPSDDAVTSPTEIEQPASDGAVAPPSEGAIEAPSDGTAAAPLDTAGQPPTDAGAADTGYVAPDPGAVDSGSVDTSSMDAGSAAPDAGVDPGYIAPEPAVDPGYVDPNYVDPNSVDPNSVDPSYVEQEPTYVDKGEDTGYVAQEPVAVEPSYAEPVSVDGGTVDAGYVAPDPVIAPSYEDPGVDANFAAPEPNNVAPEPNYVAPEPSFVDTGSGAPIPDLDAGFGGQDPSAIAPDPNFADSSMDAGFADAGNAGDGAMVPDSGSVAPDSGGDDGGGKGRHDRD